MEICIFFQSNQMEMQKVYNLYKGFTVEGSAFMAG